MLDLSRIIPDNLKPVAKAVAAFLIAAIGVLVALGVVDVDAGNALIDKIATALVIAGLTGGVVHQTTNRYPRR